MNAIEIKGLGKAYKQYTSRKDQILDWLLPARQVPRKWVLKNINLSIHQGESVGIIGINGAGKSTLLKLITGTSQATDGTIRVHGRIAAMLELGMGFHPEFTGRQNVWMAAQLLGLDNITIARCMPDIEAFAEIGEYMDQPVRVYSSGMQMRLAFSVATAIRPDILIVDEAMSVGDAYFQHKSFERIRDFRAQGTTLLLVSHDKQAIQSICDRAVLLDGGALVMEGAPQTVMDYYNARLASHQPQSLQQQTNLQGQTQTTSGTGEARVTSIELLDTSGQALECITVGQAITLRIQVQAHANLPRLVLGYAIKNRWGQVLYGTNTHFTEQVLEQVCAGDHYSFDIQFDARLGPGHYAVVTALTSTDTHLVNNYEWRDLALVFQVINHTNVQFEGWLWMPPTICITKT